MTRVGPLPDSTGTGFQSRARRLPHTGTETITLDEVSPRVVTNTADALITFAMCTREGPPFMAANGPAARSCATVTEVEGQQVHLTTGH